MTSSPLPSLLRSPRQMRAWIERERRAGRRIGFVPTMGALHEGHLSLVRAARRRCDRVVVSIFVNPTQFIPGEDYERYPRDLRGDRRKCGEIGVDAVFVPSVSALYPRPPLTEVSVPRMQRVLCGLSRPGHFEGVCLIVAKLLNIVRPDDLYLGQKDAQQAVILTRLVEDLNFDVKVRVGPTIRERDGVAMSSRNAYLTGPQRAYAPRLYQSLRMARDMIRAGERRAATITRRMRRHLGGGPGRIDYVEVVDAETLEPVKRIERTVLVALAVYVGKARLIDNVRVPLPRGSATPGRSARRHER